MKFSKDSNSNGRNGFTLFELFVLVAGFAILTLIFLPALQRPRCGCRINCTNNLKQIGLASRTWALDNGDRFPMSVSTNDGGTMELSFGPNAFAHFAAMSNELSTPAVLVCPEDKARQRATNFNVDLNNSKLSYFVGLDAGVTNTTLWLSGDRNLTNNSRLVNSILLVRPGDGVRWTREMHNGRGHILLADGRVQTVTNGAFVGILQTWTNRLAMP